MAANAVALERADRRAVWRVRRQNGKWLISRTLAENILACAAWSNGNSEDARFGTYFHDLAARYYALCRSYREESLLSETERLAREAFFEKPRGLPPYRLAEGRDLLDLFARRWPCDFRALTRTETTLAVDIGWAILRGRFDIEYRTDGGDPDDQPRSVLLEDLKTSWATGDHTFQMKWYGHSRFEEPGSEDLEEVGVRIRYPRTGLETEDYYGREELAEWWRDEVVDPLTKLWPQRRLLRPTGGTACQYCARRWICAKADLTAAQLPETLEDYEPIFRDTLRLEALLQERRKLNREFFKNRQPAVIAGYDDGYLYAKDGPDDELEIVPGRDDDVIAEMNRISPGSGEFARRDGVSPALIKREWWDHLAGLGLVEIRPKKPRPGWRKHVEKGVSDDEPPAAEAIAAGPAETTVTVLEGGLL